jgi:hypothetical protein
MVLIVVKIGMVQMHYDFHVLFQVIWLLKWGISKLPWVSKGFNMFQRSNLILDDWGTLHFNKLPPEARAGEVASPLVSVRQRQESRTTITFQKVGLSH